MATTTLDASGLKCPLPVLRARKALKPLVSGDLLEVLSTDPSSPEDFRNFCETTGDTLLEDSEENGTYRFLIQKR
jgi:tRNA 2-thiouridine synthesizing protein A